MSEASRSDGSRPDGLANPPPVQITPTMSYLIRVGILFVVYFSTAKFGLMMDAVGGFATLVWPPTGISLAALLLFGLRLWPGIALGAFLVNFVTGAPVLTAGGMALGNTLEALIGAYWLRRHAGFRNSLDRLRDVMGFIVFSSTRRTACLTTGSSIPRPGPSRLIGWRTGCSSSPS